MPFVAAVEMSNELSSKEIISIYSLAIHTYMRNEIGCAMEEVFKREENDDGS